MKKMMIVLLAGLLAGCATGSPQQLRNELAADRRYSFELDANYQQVYRRLVDVMRCRYTGNLITASTQVNSDLYTDTQTGSISVGMYGALGAQIWMVVDVRGLQNNHAQVIVMSPRGKVDALGEQVKAWASGTDTQC